MRLRTILLLSVALLAAPALPQLQPQSSGKGKPPRSEAPPRYDPGTANESSSKETKVDLSPPANDYEHPGADLGDSVQEFKKYDPHRAEKDIEVGDYYLKRKNYRAALARYRDALEYKPNDPLATYRLAQTLEQAGQADEAARYLVLYLRLQPDGEFAAAARQGMERLAPVIQAQAATPERKQAFELVNEATRLLAQDKYGAAIAQLQAALDLDPQNADAMYFLGEAREKNGQMDEARAAYLAYLKLDGAGVFARSARMALEHLPQLRGEGIPAKPELPTSLPSETPR